MSTDAGAPADTTIMRIIHDALRRDLRRAQDAIAADPAPTRPAQSAIADHLAWMMRFLRAHHESEDDGLYRLVRERSAPAAELLDRMEAQHEAAHPLIAEVESAASALTADGSSRALRRLAVALDELAAVLLPHLREEEDDAMPLVSAVITNAEWRSLEQERNIKPKSLSDLALEGHWLIDDATEDDRSRVVGLVPPVPRFVLVHGFARRYRRRKEACWGGGDSRSRRVQKRAAVAVSVPADIEAVWAIVRDVTRVGEWSHECVAASWIDGSTSASPGARFRGRNRAGLARWGRVCEVISADPHRLVWRTVPTAFSPDSCEWTIALAEESRGGTRIEQSFRVLKAPKGLDLVYGLLIPGHRDRTAALTDDLRRLGDVAVRAHVGVPEAADVG